MIAALKSTYSFRLVGKPDAHATKNEKPPISLWEQTRSD
jgi:hypothetical protein